MADLPVYKLTEEVVRQAVEVAFRTDCRWQIAFSNPTAGPWKRIRIGHYVDGDDLRFRKEEDRPDLILFDATDRVFLILEAKDDLRKLIASTSEGSAVVHRQLRRSMAVFSKELARIDAIAANPRSAALAFGRSGEEYTAVVGYVFPIDALCLPPAFQELSDLHSGLALEAGDDRVGPFVCLPVCRHDRMLTVHFVAFGMPDTASQRFRGALPVAITDLEGNR